MSKEPRTAMLCTDLDPDLFFPDDEATNENPQVKEAKDVCDRCPSKFKCLLSALRNKEEFGIWGGLLPQERDELVRRLATRQPAGMGDGPASERDQGTGSLAAA